MPLIITVYIFSGAGKKGGREEADMNQRIIENYGVIEQQNARVQKSQNVYVNIVCGLSLRT